MAERVDDNNKDNKNVVDPTAFNSSYFFEELEKELLTRGINDVDLYTGNRALIILGDFFYDDYTAREYERGLVIKGRREFVGKTIVLSRNRINHLLTATCSISGLGVFRVAYSLSWTGTAEHEEIERLLSEKRVNPHSFSVDVKLCRLLKSQQIWKFTIADLEKTIEDSDILLG